MFELALVALPASDHPPAGGVDLADRGVVDRIKIAAVRNRSLPGILGGHPSHLGCGGEREGAGEEQRQHQNLTDTPP